MNSTRLTDLDELSLSVRDRASASYILEAISAYRGGAYRSAVISTWIAVSYDIISKIRELANKNDKSAIAFVKKLDENIKNKNIVQLQVIEEGILKTAHNEFEFLAPHEFEDLQRLKEDRNRCAHPAFISEDFLFQPTPELVRTHIVHSIYHLLQRQPVQGQSAIERVILDIKSLSFPTDRENAYIYLFDKYLSRAKDALAKNLTVVLIKTLLKPDDASFEGQEQKIVYALVALSKSHADIYEQQMKSRLTVITESSSDKELLVIFRLLGADNRCWGWLSEAMRIRVKHLLKVIEESKNSLNLLLKHTVFAAYNVLDLRPRLLKIINALDIFDQAKIVADYPNPEFAERAIKSYLEAGSYRSSEEIGKSVILPMAPHFTGKQIVTLLEGIPQNSQIYHASGTAEILESFFEQTRDRLEITKGAWRNLIENLSVDSDPNDYYSYPTLRKRLTDAKVIESLPF